MKSLEQLTEDAQGWLSVQEWLESAQNTCWLVDGTSHQELDALQVSTASPMGALVHHTGGLLIDHGWLRILGGPSEDLGRSLLSWNREAGVWSDDAAPEFLLVGDDVVGGFFAINGGGLGPHPGDIYYLPSDELEWENCEIGYSHWLRWALSGDTGLFYQDVRWSGWEHDAEMLEGDECFSFYPFLYTKEGDVDTSTRKTVSAIETWNLRMGTNAN